MSYQNKLQKYSSKFRMTGGAEAPRSTTIIIKETIKHFFLANVEFRRTIPNVNIIENDNSDIVIPTNPGSNILLNCIRGIIMKHTNSLKLSIKKQDNTENIIENDRINNIGDGVPSLSGMNRNNIKEFIIDRSEYIDLTDYVLPRRSSTHYGFDSHFADVRVVKLNGAIDDMNMGTPTGPDYAQTIFDTGNDATTFISERLIAHLGGNITVNPILAYPKAILQYNNILEDLAHIAGEGTEAQIALVDTIINETIVERAEGAVEDRDRIPRESAGGPNNRFPNNTVRDLENILEQLLNDLNIGEPQRTDFLTRYRNTLTSTQGIGGGKVYAYNEVELPLIIPLDGDGNPIKFKLKAHVATMDSPEILISNKDLSRLKRYGIAISSADNLRFMNFNDRLNDLKREIDSAQSNLAILRNRNRNVSKYLYGTSADRDELDRETPGGDFRTPAIIIIMREFIRINDEINDFMQELTAQRQIRLSAVRL
jgi:hypothetical protein